jgi:hypothetical protein
MLDRGYGWLSLRDYQPLTQNTDLKLLVRYPVRILCHDLGLYVDHHLILGFIVRELI